MKTKLVWATKIIGYLICGVPLIVMSSSFIFPFIVPKIIVLRSLITLLTGFYTLLLIISWREFRPKLTPITIAVLGWLLSFALSTGFGVDPYHSFWDNHERMLGLFTIVHYVAYFLVLTATLKNWRDWRIASWIFLLAGSVVMVIGLLQVADPNFLLNQGSVRVASTLGNAIYVGGYGLFLFFISLLLIFRETQIVWRLVAGGTALLALVGINYSGTRGSMLGLFAGLGILVVGYAIIHQDYPKLRRALWSIIFVGLGAVLALYLNRQTPLVQSIPLAGRVLNSSFSTGTGSTRLIAWRIAIEGWKERPIFGWGPNNFFYVFNQYYNPRSLEFGYGETWFDNAHNIVLNTLAVQGALGVASYLALFAASILALWKNRARVNSHVVVIGTAFLTAHLVQNLTVFENPTSYLYFMFILAFISRTVIDAKDQSIMATPTPTERAIGYGTGGLVLAVCWLVIFVFNIQPARANRKTLAALISFGNNPVAGLVDIRQALAFSSPHIDDIRSDLARQVMTLVSASYQQLGAASSRELLDTITEPLKQNLELHPRDIRNQLSLAQIYQVYAVSQNNPQYFVQAVAYLRDALRYSPRRQQLVYSLAGIVAQLGDMKEAAGLLEQVISDNPKVGETYWRLAYLYNFMGDLEHAKQIIDRARAADIVFAGPGEQVIQSIMATWEAKHATGTKP